MDIFATFWKHVFLIFGMLTCRLTSATRFQIIFAAASDTVESHWDTVEFPDGPAGLETAGLDGKVGKLRSKSRTTPVPLTTVDTLVHDLKLPKVDILIIDAEGADPAVLQGAEKTLNSVRYMMFETHRWQTGTHWEKTTILHVLRRLNGYGFECYWAGNNGKLYSITSCYTEEFEESHWGNIVCVKRQDVWFSIMESADPNSR